MRQAGRYLPEYRAIRSRTASFLDLCYAPDLAAEVTLQPLKRFDLDGAILFADILVVPHAMGLDVRFDEEKGPVVETISDDLGVERLRSVQGAYQVARVCETVASIKAALGEGVTLIGFCGAPWTVASYIVGGAKAEGRESARAVALEYPDWFAKLIDRLVEASQSYLISQIDAGAEVVQIFDSWAGDLPFYLHERLVGEPIAKIVGKLAELRPRVPVIVFTRGIGANHKMIRELTKPAGMSIEPSLPLAWARDHLLPDCVVQGNLDPVALECGGVALRRGVEEIVMALPAERHIFNLGHGIRPATLPKHVEETIALVRQFDEANKR